MCLWECRLIHATFQFDLMLVVQIRQVDGKATATPDKFQVCSTFGIIEGFKDSPESANDRVILLVVWEDSYSFKSFDVNFLFASASSLKGLPVQEVENLCLLLNDLKEAFTNDLDLLFSLLFTSFEYLIDEIANVGLCHLDIFSVRAERYFITT